MPDLSSIN